MGTIYNSTGAIHMVILDFCHVRSMAVSQLDLFGPDMHRVSGTEHVPCLAVRLFDSCASAAPTHGLRHQQETRLVGDLTAVATVAAVR